MSRITRNKLKEQAEESLRTVEEQWLVRAGHQFRNTGAPSLRDKLQNALPAVGTAERVVSQNGRGYGFAGGCRSGRLCDTEQLPAQDQLFVADAVGQKAKAADADETAGERCVPPKTSRQFG